MPKLFGGMEGGGTKFVCAVGNGPENIVEIVRIPNHHSQRNPRPCHCILQKI